MTTPNIPQPHVKAEPVPQELIGQMHEATEQLHRAGEHVAEALSARASGTDENAQALNELHDANRRLDEVDGQVKQEMKKA